MRLYISTYWFFCPYVCDGFFLRLCLCFDDDSITRREFGHVYTYMCDNCSVHICVNHCLSHASLYSRLALRFRNLCVASPHFKVMSYVLKPPAVIARQSAHELSHDEVVDKWYIACRKTRVYSHLHIHIYKNCSLHISVIISVLVAYLSILNNDSSCWGYSLINTLKSK